jgi:hypothetical protein
VAFALLWVGREVVMQGTTGRVIVGLLWLTILVIVAAAWGVGARSTERSGAAVSGPPPSVPASSIRPSSILEGQALDGTALEPPSAPELDLFGNEVERAVSDYRVDVRGDIYERHSPDTAVTHLTAPSL